MGGKKEDEDGCGEGGIRKSSPVTENERRVRTEESRQKGEHS